ncbi:ABC transporter substrate-binding protein [Martelella soudanensis]|uniref:ABC transporter substrate-binding protein n=1 Tax=Martelella sp. NC20 TaxID=2740298 RepID=UPI0015DFF545|nr:extracellular solute-binding protein [Martelella sp. NC20]
MNDFMRMKRRTFLAGSAATIGAAGLPSLAFGAEEIKFWDMVWGASGYTNAAREVALAYEPAAGLGEVSYQSIPWANWYQTFTSAAASRTTPAVSSGAAFLPFYFMEQGVMIPADNLVSKLDAAGKNDFLPGLLEAMTTHDGIAAMPWSMDLRVLWYRRSLLEKAGADVPTDWDSYIVAGEKLAKIGAVGLGIAASSTTTDAKHTISALMINNGGGFFAKDGSLDCVNDRNIETLEFLKECVAKKIIDPYAISYSSDNVETDWINGHIAMGFGQTGMDRIVPENERDDLQVANPILGPHGDKGTVYYLNPLMMFDTTPSQDSSEAFLEYYLDNIKVYWESGVITDLPVKRSIADLPVIQNNPKLVLAINEWQPHGKTIAAQSSEAFGALNAVDGGNATATFAQRIVEGKSDSRKLLEDLQGQLEKIMN